MSTAAYGITAALLCVLVVLLVTIGVRAWLRSRISSDERERRRRLMLLSTGKMGDANLLEIRDGLLFYSYAVRGVEYTASQDVSSLTSFVPDGVASLGSICVKYDPRNPANSIVLAEEWSGLRPWRA
ncbi:MAG: hypothetical protein ABSH24_16145 [Bryobacteraceae bacterium]